MQVIEHEAERPQHLQILAPRQLVTVIDKAAKRTFSSRSAYIRRAVMLALKTDGLMRGSDSLPNEEKLDGEPMKG